MNKIVFSWSDYLRRDVSLFEEVEFAPIRVLLKYIYPDDLVGRLPPSCRPICETLTEKLQTLHVNLYSEEAIQELYLEDSVSLKTGKIAKFIDDSLRRLLEPKEHPSHVLFNEEMIPALVKFFVDLIKKPATTVVSPDLTPLSRPLGPFWIHASSELLYEIEISHSRFLFHYFVSYLRKLVECCDVDGLWELRLRPMEDVISSFSKENVEDLFSPRVTSPKIADFEIDDERCLVWKCAVREPRSLAMEILGSRVLFALTHKSRRILRNFIEDFSLKHRELCLEMANWLGTKSATPTIINSLVAKLNSIVCSSFPCLFTSHNLEAAYRQLSASLPLISPTSNKSLLDSIAVEFNPEPLSFIDSLSSHVRPIRQSRLADHQQALFYNTLFFYYHYVVHWIRRISRIELSTDGTGLQYILKPRDEEEKKELLNKMTVWVTNRKAILKEHYRKRAEKRAASSSIADRSRSSTPNEDAAQSASTSAPQGGEIPVKGSKASEAPDEEESIASKQEEKKRKRQKSEEYEESANGDQKNDDTETVVMQSKKKKKEERHSESDDDMKIIEIVQPKERIPRLKGKRKKSREVAELSSDDESHMFPDDAWEQKWKSERDRLFKDQHVPALVTLTLQTVLENSRCLRFQLKALGS